LLRPQEQRRDIDAMTSSAKPPSFQGGFTLIELVVVIVVAAILAAVAYNRIDVNTVKAGAFKSEATAAIRYAQKLSVAQRRNVYVCVTASSLALHYSPGCNASVTNPVDGSAFAVSVTDAARKYASVLVTFSPATTFFFDSLGRPNPATTIIVADSAGSQTITVEAESGFVH
jgi:MSHA pilin protein MshC